MGASINLIVSMRLKQFVLPLLILFVATLLRVHALGRDVRFISDEAFYATFARSAVVNGNWALSGELDKPPLSIYMGAVAMRLWAVYFDEQRGVWEVEPLQGEFAVRLANVFISILQVAVLFPLAKALFKTSKIIYMGTTSAQNTLLGSHSQRGTDASPHFTRLRVGRVFRGGVNLPALLFAFSPFAVAFSATAFTDNLMLLCISLALLCAARGRWSAAGAWLAAGFASKPQAILYLPLLVLIAWGLDRVSWRGLMRFCLVFASGVGLLLLWDVLRDKPTSIWALGAPRTNPGRLLRSNEVLPHLGEYAAYASWMLGTPLVTALMGLLTVAALLYRNIAERHLLGTVIDLLLVTYALGYGLLHWLVAFPVYDRYLLPLLPIGMLLAARALHLPLCWRFGRRVSALLIVAMCSTTLMAAWSVGDGAVPIGGDQGANVGIDALAAHLNAKPFGTIYYHYWLGFELEYYMGYWTDKRRVFYPTPDSLVEDALRNPDPLPRYFVAPSSVSVEPFLDSLRRAGFRVTQDYRADGFIIYQLIVP